MKRVLYFSFALAVFLVFNSCDTPLSKYEPKNDDEKKILKLLNTYVDARNSKDLVKLQSTFHDDGTYMGGRGGNFSKSEFSKINWKEEDIELYNLDIKINGNLAKVTTIAKYYGGTWKTTHVYTLTNNGDKWLIMKKDHY